MTEFLSHSKALEQLLHAHRQTKDGHLFTDQSLDYLRWRYSEYPYANYMAFYQERSGVLSGCIILRPNARFGLKEVVLDELLLPNLDDGLASSLLDELERCLKADYLITYFPKRSFQRDILRKHGFHQVPRGGQNFVVKMLASHLSCNPMVIGNWDLSIGDLEIF